MVETIEIPHNWNCRDYQKPSWLHMEKALMESAKANYRIEGGRCSSVWHRRAGKDDTSLNFMAWSSQIRVGSYWHIFPKYNQAKKAIWQEKRRDGRKYLDIFPNFSDPGSNKFVTRKREDEMYFEMSNGSSYQLIGADNTDNLVGSGPVGLILSEYPLIPREAIEYLMPMVLENGGWVWWVYTPRGKRNHGYQHYKSAKKDPKHHCELLTINDTRRHDGTQIVTDEQVQKMIDDGLYTYEKARQEFYCDWDVDMTGAYYKHEVARAKEDGRWECQTATYQPDVPVDTFLDIGRTDYITIIFVQRISSREWRVIGCYWNSQKDLRHYISVMKQRGKEGGWKWGTHYAPHDIKVTDWASNNLSRLQIARSLGIVYRVMKKVAKVSLRIEATRNAFGKFVFNGRCKEITGRKGLLDAIEMYAAEYNEDKEDFNEVPAKSWANHYADAFGAIALAYADIKDHVPPREDFAQDDWDPFNQDHRPQVKRKRWEPEEGEIVSDYNEFGFL